MLATFMYMSYVFHSVSLGNTQRVLNTLLITIPYTIAVICAVYPKQHWQLFARNNDGEPWQATYYQELEPQHFLFHLA
jgi:hypothetical protein